MEVRRQFSPQLRSGSHGFFEDGAPAIGPKVALHLRDCLPEQIEKFRFFHDVTFGLQANPAQLGYQQGSR
jgi:hypothetical protein